MTGFPSGRRLNICVQFTKKARESASTMDDFQALLRVQGTVMFVDDIGSIHVGIPAVRLQ